jgi:hypothetical protein
MTAMSSRDLDGFKPSSWVFATNAKTGQRIFEKKPSAARNEFPFGRQR